MGDVRIGDKRVSFTMQPLDTTGRTLNGGNHYANADTLEAAREYAARVIGRHYGGVGSTFVEGVSISGRLYEMGADAWREVRGPEARAYAHWEVIRHPEPAPLVPWLDNGKRCYFTTVLDYPEWVHERRSNGTCQCGKVERWEW